MVQVMEPKLVAWGRSRRNYPSDQSCGNQRFVWRTFFNTPARLKYMKSQQAELSHIIDIVNRLGLAHPGDFFQLD